MKTGIWQHMNQSKFVLQKSKSSWNLWQASANPVLTAISALNSRESYKKIPNIRWKLEEMFKIYDSERKELQDEEFI